MAGRSDSDVGGTGVRYGAEYPNFPDVSGTSLPLLTTVLAGFAVTITVQLMMGSGLDENLSARAIAALIVFLLATLLLLSSTVFAVNAQAHNYLPFLDLSDIGAARLHVTDPDRWIGQLARRWYGFHVAALVCFYLGVVLFLIGTTLTVWVFVGSAVATVVLVACLVNLLVVVGVGWRWSH